MTLLGCLAMPAIGLLPLLVLARLTGVEQERLFLLPLPLALLVASLVGLAVCLVVGRVMGLLTFEQLEVYAARHAAEVAATRGAERRALRSEARAVRP